MTSPSSPPPAPSRGTHTPGPWMLGSRHGHNRTEVVTSPGGGRAICAVWTHEGGHRSADNQPVAYIETPEGMANARLIASAPTLATENARLREFVERVSGDMDFLARHIANGPLSVMAGKVANDADVLLSTLARGGAS